VVGFGIAEISGASVPRQRFVFVALRATDADAIEEGWVERLAHSQSPASVSDFDRAIVVEPRRGDIAQADQRVAARHQGRGLRRR